jgi:hypothetical protein
MRLVDDGDEFRCDHFVLFAPFAVQKPWQPTMGYTDETDRGGIRAISEIRGGLTGFWIAPG